jgi:hypothetical protein
MTKLNNSWSKIDGVNTKFEITSGDDAGLRLDGQFSVGKWNAPHEVTVGQGDSTTDGMLIYQTDDHVTFTNVTPILSSDTGSTTNLFGGTTSGNTLYLGSEFIYSGVKVKISADGIVEPNNVVAEYYTSAGWIPVNYMSSDANPPYDQHGYELAQNGHLNEQWRLNFDPYDRNAEFTKSFINGVEKYWGRFRITDTITTDPLLEQMKIHTSRWECNADGSTEYFGRARYKRTIISGIKSLENNSAQSPANESVQYTSGVSAGYTDNELVNGFVDSRLFVLNIPEGVDTSIPVEVKVSWYVKGTSTGDVEFKLSKIPVADGYVYDGSSVLEGTFAETTTISASSNLIRNTTTLYLDVHEAIPGQVTYMCVLQRDATGTNPNDTVADNVVMTHIIGSAYFWAP